MKKLTILFFCISLLLVSCNKTEEKQEETTTSTTVQTTSTTKKTTVQTTTKKDLTGLKENELTGLYIKEEVKELRPFAVMINNHQDAMPQSGLEEADVIYETLAEGGITRLVAVFKDFEGEKIGPVRSARHYFLNFSFDHDAIYVHYGKSPQASIAFVELNSPNLDGLSYLDLIMCYQDPERVRPHSTFTSYKGLNAGLDAQGYRKTMKEDFPSKLDFSDDDIALKGKKAEKVTLDFSYYQIASFVYDKTSKKYKRFQFDGAKHIDAVTGKQLETDNIIIQFANMWNIAGDTEGRLDMELVGAGTGYYIYGGKYIPIKWEKTDIYEPTKYYLEDGKKLEINKGKTWIEVYPTGRDMITFE